MNYEHRYRPKWWQVTLLAIYGTVSIYAVLVSNPYLYSSKEFQVGLAGKKEDGFEPIITSLERPDAKSAKDIQNPNRFGWKKQATEDSGETRDRRYIEMTLSPLFTELDKKPQNIQWRLLRDHVLALFEDGQVKAVDYEGKTLWTFTSQDVVASGFGPEPAADLDSVYLVAKNGRIYNLKLSNGRLYWKAQIHGQFLSDAFLDDKYLYLVEQISNYEPGKKTPQLQSYLRKVRRDSGTLAETSTELNVKGFSEFSYDRESQRLIVVSDERILSIQLPKMEIIWQKSLSSPVIGPAVIAEGQVMLSLKEGKFKSLELAKGSDAEEVDLEHPVASAPAYIPIHKRAAITTLDGYQHVVDTADGKRLWRFDLSNKNRITTSWSARLSGNFIEEMGMKWALKGWTIWSPCAEFRICIYNPEKGQIVGRVMLGGSLASLPEFKERSFHVVLEKDSSYAIGKYVEQPLAKKATPTTETPEVQ